jgi:ATP-dependent Clp protease ATP-binding subunit ClpX
MFICGGAFDGISELISQRIGRDIIGFNNIATQAIEKDKAITRADVINFGLIPEFTGRFSLLVQLEDLTKEDLLRILTDPQNAIIKQYEKLFAMDDIKIEFTQSALEVVVTEAMARKSGARELKAILDDALIDLMFEAPSYKQKQNLVIDAEFITKKLCPRKAA